MRLPDHPASATVPADTAERSTVRTRLPFGCRRRTAPPEILTARLGKALGYKHVFGHVGASGHRYGTAWGKPSRNAMAQPNEVGLAEMG